MRKMSVTGRAFRVYNALNRKYFPAVVLRTFFDKLSPFFNLWISAEIVTGLYEGWERDRVFLLVAIALGGNLVIRVMAALLTRAVNTQQRILDDNQAATFVAKTLSLDYVKLEDPEIRTLRRKIMENACINSYGVVYMRNNFRNAVDGLFDVLLSLLFFGEMLSLASNAGISLLGIILIAGMLLCMAGSFIYTQHSGKKLALSMGKLGDVMLKENRFSNSFHLSGQDVRMYRQMEKVSALLNKLAKDHRRLFKEVNTTRYLLGLPTRFLQWLTTLCSYLVVCLYCVLGAFPVGSVIKYTGYLNRFFGGIGNLMHGMESILENEPYLKVYLEYFDLENDMYQGSLAVEKRSDKKYEIEFSNVSFKYPGSEVYALKDVNLSFNVGERLAVVGMNGSGKTTFIKLMCRLYDPSEGEIRMNDFNIRKYDYREYLDLFSVVFQDYKLLSLPLGNNVSSAAIWDAEKAESCLREVGFGERFAEMAKGLDTPLYKNFDDEGVNVSGGEAQKIALARALYKDAPFIILDEPTAALDPIAEAEIYAKFDEIVGDKTAIYISHRLSSCRFCDKIVVFDEGRIVQVGSHEELLCDTDGKYYELWNAQAQYYTEKKEVSDA